MTIFLNIIIATFLISLIAFIGALTLFLKEKLLDKILLILVAFSAGALIGGAFFHLIPEALESAGLENSLNVFLYVICGFSTFFILENFIKWHHCHKREHVKIMPFSYLILVSDAVHNFIDGLIIAVSFVNSFSIGIITTLVVAFHEIPQEIGNFGVLVYGGIKKTKALLLNFLSATTVLLGGMVGYFISGEISGSITLLLGFAAGSFIYIASSDLIPEIKTCGALEKSASYFFVFLLGVGLMLLLRLFSL